MFSAMVQQTSRKLCGVHNFLGSVWLRAFVSSLLMIPGSALAQNHSSAPQGIHNVFIIMQENRSFDTPDRHLTMLCLGCSNTSPTPPTPPPMPPASRSVEDIKVPRSFLGFAMEYFNTPGGVAAITSPTNGQQATVINLLDNLGAYNGPPVLRMGGNSEDLSWWDPNGQVNPQGIHYTITPELVDNVSGVINQTHSQLIVGLNLTYSDPKPDPSLAVSWATAALLKFPANSILAFEIGNEPNLFPHNGLRPTTYTYTNYLSDYNTFLDALLPVFEGHRLAAGPTFTQLGYKFGNVPQFIQSESPHLALVTQHMYALNACQTNTSASNYASIANLLADNTSHSYATLLAPEIAAAQPYNIPVRMDEMSYMLTPKSECTTKTASAQSIINSFASALWTADVAFEMANAGADGFNVQTSGTFGPSSSVPPPFYFTNGSLVVNPMYYGMLFFARAVQNNATLIPATVKSINNGNVKVWATVDASNTIHVAVLEKDLSGEAAITVQMPAGITSRGRLISMTAASATATNGITFGGQTFDGSTDGLPIGKASSSSVYPQGGRYTFNVPAPGAAILEIPNAQHP